MSKSLKKNSRNCYAKVIFGGAMTIITETETESD